MTSDVNNLNPVTTSAAEAIATALRLSAPSWPLQNLVAVNPFWYRRDESFSGVMDSLASTLHTNLYMPFSYYLDKYRSGAIHESALSRVIEARKSRDEAMPDNVDELLRWSAVDASPVSNNLTFVEFYDKNFGSSWRHTTLNQIAKYAAAYFDDTQAVVGFPWRGLPFWQAWLAAQEYDRSMQVSGLTHWRDTLRFAPGLSARDFIDHALSNMNLGGAAERSAYLSRLLATGLGWSTQFQHCQWQRSLGYEETPDADPVDYLAVLLAYDYAVATCLSKKSPDALALWRATLAVDPKKNASQSRTSRLHEIWQTAAEISYLTTVAEQIKLSKTPHESPRVQLVFCIDVRSEMLRRALEHVSSEIVTVGFAGFFGIPIDHKRAGEDRVSHRLPVLLQPAFQTEENLSKDDLAKANSKAAGRAFLRNLRKAPLSSFAYVELFGIYALAKLARRSIESLLRQDVKGAPKRFANQNGLVAPDLDEAAKVERAAAVLRHMGLTRHFARLVVITGHGSASTNNAFASALDCGACGGHAGDINARFLVSILNDAVIRQRLASRGIKISAETWFIAAIHETVTDSIHLIDADSVPRSHLQDLARLEPLLKDASERTRQERQTVRSLQLDPCAARRMRSWSEVRPEWGLAGNACFIVAPRAWTKAASFGSRAFLHDYDAASDLDYATLELIMTAPMVVTNWINLQYYASTVAPAVYGSGDKTLHNIVDERGVQEGNGGDLRVGLPLQSVHDGQNFVHEPLRLSVFIAAPREAIEKVIAGHAVVRELVDHQWLHLLHINAHTGEIALRLPGGLYRPLPTKVPA